MYLSKPKAIFLTILMGVTTILYSCRQESTQLTFKYYSTHQLDSIHPLDITHYKDQKVIADAANNRLMVWDTAGKVKSLLTGMKRPMHLGNLGDTLLIPEYLTDTVWMYHQGGKNPVNLSVKLDAPSGMDGYENALAIADFYNHRILIYQMKADTTFAIGSKGHDPGELFYPTDVAWGDSLLYIADAYNNRVQSFDFKHREYSTIGRKDSLKVATGITVSDSYLFVTDSEHGRVLVYDKTGNLRRVLEKNLEYPTGLHFDGQMLYIADFHQKKIVVYSLR